MYVNGLCATLMKFMFYVFYVFYVFVHWVLFHFKRHPYFAIWSVACVMIGVYDSFIKDIYSVFSGIIIGFLPWFLYRIYRMIYGHSLRDRIERSKAFREAFEKYLQKIMKEPK